MTQIKNIIFLLFIHNYDSLAYSIIVEVHNYARTCLVNFIWYHTHSMILVFCMIYFFYTYYRYQFCLTKMNDE